MKFNWINRSMFMSLSLVCLLINSCGKEENVATDVQAAAVISPQGHWVAPSMDAIKESIRPSIEAAFSENVLFEITHHDFFEDEIKTAMTIKVKTTIGFEKQVVFVRERASTNLRTSEKCYTVSCDGDCSCPGIVNIFPGGVHVSCDGNCSCSMTIRPSNCK